MKKIFLFLSILTVSFPIFLYGFENMEINAKEEIRIDTRKDEDSSFGQEVKILIPYSINDTEMSVKLGPYVHNRIYYERDNDSYTEIGGELKLCFGNYAYVGQRVFYLLTNLTDSYSMDEDATLTTTLLGVNIPVFKIFERHVNIDLFEEYYFEFDRGEGTRNAIGCNLNVPIFDMVVLSVGWLHIDRIHSYDSDQFTSTVALKF